MFTGIVEEVGRIQSISRGAHSAVLEIAARTVLEDAHIGDSIAVNGVCLTVTQLGSGRFFADVMHETLNRSSLADLAPASRVNLERAMAANGRFGGHIVAGHIDDTGSIRRIQRDDNAVLFTIAAAPGVLRYIVEKGSVAIDGISLTVAAVAREGFTISAIPHTVAQTVLADRRVGDVVNIEVDMIGKYIEKLCAAPAQDDEQKSHITSAFLAQNGF
ncbi:MAG: riboflavin synthase [Peptococcaceae bacterium]|nr:riboflavin synthase [Peptococcaceae bacterium]